MNIFSIVRIRKKNDLRDLKNTCSKDDFSLPITELMIPTTGHEALSFMDCSYEYNQICMTFRDKENTAFKTPTGI